MAFTVSTRTDTETSNTTSHTTLIPNGSNVSGKLVLILFASDGGPTVTWPTGGSADFTSVVTGVQGSNTRIAVGYRIVTGSEGWSGTNDSVTITTSSSEMSNSHSYLISGAHASQAPEGASTATGNDANPNPPSLNPSWGSEETLFVAFAATRFATTFSAAPTNYTDLINGPTEDDANASAGSARRVLTADSEDPGTFTNGGGANWITTTVAVRIAAAGDATASPAVITLSTALPAAAVSTTAAPAVIARSLTLPAPGVSVGAAPAVIVSSASLPAPTVSTAAAPGVVALVVAMPQASPGESGSVTASPAVIDAPVTLPQSAVSVAVAPSTLALAGTLPAPAVSIGAAPAVIATGATLPRQP